MNPQVQDKVNLFSSEALSKFLEIRSLIFQIASDNELGDIEETLKWGQPSYLCKTGSTIRVDWQEDTPNSINLFFNCKSILVETFREVYADVFSYRGNRIVSIPLNTPLPSELEPCLLMALNYHRLKKRPLLGA